MRDFVVCLIFQQSAIFANYPLSIDRGCTRLVSFSSLTLCKALRSIDFPTCRPEKSLRTHSSPHIVYNYPRQLPSTQRLTWFFSLPRRSLFRRRGARFKKRLTCCCSFCSSGSAPSDDWFVCEFTLIRNVLLCSEKLM